MSQLKITASGLNVLAWLIAPEGAALWQAFKKLKASQWIKAGETVLMINTGSGYKYLENINID